EWNCSECRIDRCVSTTSVAREAIMSTTELHASHDALRQAFANVLAGPDAVLTDADALAAHGHDYWGLGNPPGMVVKPQTTDEVVAIVRIAAEHGVPLVTRGGASNC